MERAVRRPSRRSWRYLEHVADRFDLPRHFRSDTAVTRRRVRRASHGPGRSDHRRRRPPPRAVPAVRHRLPVGAASAGHRRASTTSPAISTTRRTGRNSDPDFAGKRVGLLGTGSSGIQATPLIADAAAALTVFQRSPNYSVPMPNRPWTDEDMRRIRAEYPQRRRRAAYAPAGTPHTSQLAEPAARTSPQDRAHALRQRWTEGGVLFSKTFPDQLTDPAANDLAREFAEARIRELVADPAVAKDLIPVDHPIGTKRICTDSGYYPMFNREHVRLVNLRREPITDCDGHRRAHRRARIPLRCTCFRDRIRRDDRRADPDRSGRPRWSPADRGVGGRARHLPRADGAPDCRTCSASAVPAAPRCWRTWCCTPKSRSTGWSS